MATPTKPAHVLVALDQGETVSRVADRVVSMAREAGGELEVTLFHMLPPIPIGHLEHGGGDTPEEQREKDERHARRRAEWVEEARRAAQPVLDAVTSRLRVTGVRPTAVHHTFHAPDRYDENVPDEALALARERGCDTLLVGRESWPWYRELVQRHVADVLEERAQDGVRVEVVD
jgi:hypothetical protein